MSIMRSMELIDQVVRTRRFTLGVPDRFTVTADGATVLFLRSRAGDDPVACLWALDLDRAEERVLADPARTHPAPEPARDDSTGVAGYAVSRAAGLVAFTVAGELWAVDTGGGPPRRLPAMCPAADPRPDPAGHRIGYLCDGALRVIGADGSGDRAVLTPDGPDVAFGIGVHTEATSADGNRGYWWAPDGGALLAARVDKAGVGLWYIADPAEPGTPPRAVRYSAAGTASAEVTLWILSLDGTRTPVRWDSAAFEYLPGAGWDDHGPYALVQSRDQCTVRFLGIDPATGQTTVLDEQRDARWVQLVPGLPARGASGALITHADLAGTRHLTVNGAAVTPPGLQLREVLAVDGERVLFTASQDPARTQLLSYRPGEGLTWLTAGPGVHSGAGRAGTVVRVTRRTDRPEPRAEVLRDGKQPIALASAAERPVLAVRPTRLLLGPRDLRADLYLPSWYRLGSGRLPVLADPYGGAAAQKVTDALSWASLVSQWFAEQGFAVLVADGSGTPGRGPDWEREVHGDLFGPAIEDQVTALREAARRFPDLDLGRVGIRGWSFGGSLAAMAVLRRPDVFHVAVAGAGVTDQRLYDAHWRERFIGHPARFPERYEANSLIMAAPKLTRPLLLIHGLIDDNVHPANTLRLSSALLAAGRPHEVLLLPGTGHQAMGSARAPDLLRHQARFLARHLGMQDPAPEPPADTTMADPQPDQ